MRDNLYAVLDKWLPKYRLAGIPLSVETHVTGEVFVFQGLEDYLAFMRQFPGLGVLIDVSHNCYDGYSEEKILTILEPLRIGGLHLSDAVSGVDLEMGTHLPIGKGNVDFRRTLESFADSEHVHGALEIKSSYSDIKCSLEKLEGILSGIRKAKDA